VPVATGRHRRRTISGERTGAGVSNLNEAADLWRTPDTPASGGPRNRQTSIGNGHQITIAEQAEHWQTPGTDSFRSRGGDRKDEMGLDQEARTWFPTPAARDYRTPNAKPYTERGGGSKGEQLQNFVEHLWPTPNANPSAPNNSTDRGNGRISARLTDQCLESRAESLVSRQVPVIPDGPPSSQSGQTSRRRLNPQFVEWLMGFPIGWTAR